jgi:hypothetical protein
VQTEVYLTPLSAGVTKTSDEPSFNPILYSGPLIVTTTVTVPDLDGAYLVEFYVESGEWSIQFNMATMAPALEMAEGQAWSRRMFARLIDSIIITKTSVSGKIWVQIEKA